MPTAIISKPIPLYIARRADADYWIVTEGDAPNSPTVCMSDSEVYARAIAHALNVTRALAVQSQSHPNWN